MDAVASVFTKRYVLPGQIRMHATEWIAALKPTGGRTKNQVSPVSMDLLKGFSPIIHAKL
jgi:hypothetical protein